MSNPKILVTGGAGYIGSHSTRLLADQGYSIIVVDNLVYGHREAILSPEVELIVGDIGDKVLMHNIFSKNDIDMVLHFAAYAYVGESVTDPEKYYQNNIAAPLNLLGVMKEHDCRRFIFSSTCATYGNPEYIPIDENHPQNPINPYGKSKKMLETVLMDYAAAYDFHYVFLRYFNAAGASLDGKIGEDHDPETHLIPLILDAVTGDRDHITVFGTDYDTPDGTAVRDYIHVADLARAHLLAVEHLSGGGDSLICNLGTGNGHSVKEVIAAAERVTGNTVPVVYGERRAGDPPRLVANPSFAKEALGWEAEYKDIDPIIASAWKWKNGSRSGHY
ncbi:MAG TPA: UDP-glucose 4-epimerase GalE [Balneolales bacterium]|nr:UDP-glucose 4-epimerase GalE [Balneolales bacterium]